MKKIIFVGIVSLALISCSKSNISATGKNSIAIDKVNGNMNITYNETPNNSDEDKNKETNNNKIVDNDLNSIAVNNDEVKKKFITQTSNSTNENIKIVNNKAFLNGRELDMDLSHGVSVSYTNDELTMNGQKPKFKK